MHNPSEDDLQSYFYVQRVSNSFKQAIPKRGRPIRPFPGVSNTDANWMKLQAYSRSNLQEYNPCWTGEMASRPIPFISTDSKPLYAQQLMERNLPAVLDYLLPHITPAIQPINKISALGYPVSTNPGEGKDERGQQIYMSKFDVMLDLFQELAGGDYSRYDDGYHTIGVRKQNEPPDKERVFQFITHEGRIVQRTIDASAREIDVPELGTMIGSRTRTIVRPPVLNLWLQCWDSMLHNAIMSHPLCDSNVYRHEKWPTGSSFITFDCKHYERYLGMAAITYASTIGGAYGSKLDMLIRYPFIVPSDDWLNCFEVQPLFKKGVYPQFSSGLSPVAPLGKLTNICAQVEYFHTHKHLDKASAVATVFSGVSEGLRRWMYGDDNRVMGSNQEMRDYVNFMSTVFDIEEDERPKYLGMVYAEETNEFMLPASTYQTKLYQPERDFSFKSYPFLGMYERRAVFSSFGEPIISSDLIPFENELWDEIEVPYTTIVARATAERLKASAAGVTLDRFTLTDKDYLLSDQEQVSTGRFWHLAPDVVATIILSVVGTAVKERLKFKDSKLVSIPKPTTHRQPFVQKQYEEDTTDTESGDWV